MIRSKTSSFINSVPASARLFVVFALLFSLLYLSSACSHHPPRERGISHRHLAQANDIEAGKVSQPDAHHSFEDAELWSKRFDAPRRKDWQKPMEVIKLMEIEPGMTVADIGAGTGYFLGYLSNAVGVHGTVLALDVEPNMVDFLTTRAKREGWPNVEVRTVQPDDPGLHAATVDRILIVNTWHHIYDDRERSSRKLYEALTPGGEIFVVDFTQQSSHGPPVSQRVRPEEVMVELQAGGSMSRFSESHCLTSTSWSDAVPEHRHSKKDIVNVTKKI